MPDNAILEILDVSAGYGHLIALQQINLKIASGDLIVVLGPNGAGKSTLLRAISGLIGCATGHIYFDGQDITKLPAFKRARAGLSLVPEGRGTFPGLSVEDNLDLGSRLNRSGKVDAALLKDNLLRLFPKLKERLWQDCSSLSGGEMQMLAISRAIAGNPKVLLLDEPSLGLAPIVVDDVYRALGELNANGLAMVIVEQKEVPLWRVPNQTLVLRASQVVSHVCNAELSSDELVRLYTGGQEVGTV